MMLGGGGGGGGSAGDEQSPPYVLIFYTSRVEIFLFCSQDSQFITLMSKLTAIA